MGVEGATKLGCPPTLLPGGGGAEVPPRVLHLPHVWDLHW